MIKIEKDEIILIIILGILIGASIIVGAIIIANQEPTVIYVNETNATNTTNDTSIEVPQETTSESSVASSSSKDSSSSSSSKGSSVASSSSKDSSGVETYDKILSSDDDGHYVAESVAYNDGSQGDTPGYYKVVYNEEGPISHTRVG